MHTLSCRRPPPHSAVGRQRFNELPDDIIILILCQCRIDELLALRLVGLKTRNAIDEYIATIAPAVARSTFPLQDHLVKPPGDGSAYTLKWLKRLIPQQLATILVDQHRFSHDWTSERYGIPAEDAYGDALRTRVANGWCVLRRLAKISEEVYALHPKAILKSATDMALKVVHPSRYKFEVFRQREELILKRRLQYIGSLPGDSAKDYKLMFVLLSSTFRTSITNHGDEYTPWIFDWSCGIDGQRLLRRGTSWLTWFILHEGPEVFWRQWWTLPPELPETRNYIRETSIEAWFEKTKMAPQDFIRQYLPNDWNDVNQKWHDLQRDFSSKVHKALEEKAAASCTDFTAVNPIAYFTRYAELRQLREEAGIPPVKETLSHVPFHVDFRCPEELFQKFCMLRQERGFAISSQPRN